MKGGKNFSFEQKTRGKLRTGLKEALGVREGGLGVAKKEEEELKDAKKKGKMHQHAWLVSPSHSSCLGIVMETPEGFQILRAMATMW